MPPLPKGSDTDADLLAALEKLGFTGNEARAYLALSQSYPATAYEVANRAGLPRANAYTVLRTLEAKGAVQAVNESPVRYAPLNPEDYFGIHAQRTQALCAAVAKRVAAQSRADEDSFMWFYEGDEAIHRKTVELIDQARERVWIKGPRPLIEPLLPSLKGACERGVQVVIVAFGEQIEALKVHRRMEVLPHEGDAGLFRGATAVMLTMATDFNGVLIATHTPGAPASASYARNRSVIYVVQTLLLHEFYLAEMYATIGDQLNAAFGKGLAKLRKKYRPVGMERHVLGEV